MNFKSGLKSFVALSLILLLSACTKGHANNSGPFLLILIFIALLPIFGFIAFLMIRRGQDK